MNEEYKHYLDLRMQYLSEENVDMNPQTQHSLIVEEIPQELRSDKALLQYFENMFPGVCADTIFWCFVQIIFTKIHSFTNYLYIGKVHSTSIVLNLPDLEKVASKT